MWLDGVGIYRIRMKEPGLIYDTFRFRWLYPKTVVYSLAMMLINEYVQVYQKEVAIPVRFTSNFSNFIKAKAFYLSLEKPKFSQKLSLKILFV